MAKLRKKVHVAAFMLTKTTSFIPLQNESLHVDTNSLMKNPICFLRGVWLKVPVFDLQRYATMAFS